MTENITCTFVSEGVVNCNGSSYLLEAVPLNYLNLEFWLYFGIYTLLTLGAGLMSGLTLGLLSLDTLSLEVLIKADQGKEAVYARRLLPLIQHHHLLLVTLLLGNAACVESMPIFLDRISDPITAILVSVTAVLFFGEIFPQAVCKKYGLAVGYYTLPIVYFLMGVAFVLSWPISKLLDCIFGHDTATYYKRGQLKALVDLHGPQGSHSHPTYTRSGTTAGYYSNGGAAHLETAHTAHQNNQPPFEPLFTVGSQSLPLETKPDETDNPVHHSEPSFDLPSKSSALAAVSDALSEDEVMIIKGALDLTSKVARDAMVPLDRVFMMSSTEQLGRELVMKIMCYAHSRIPIYLDQDRRMIQGILITKMTILNNADDSTPITSLMQDPKCFRSIPYVTEDTPLYHLLNIFQTGKTGHMAVVVKEDIEEKELDALENLYEQRAIEGHMVSIPPPVIGIITLEDIFEQLLQEPIEDESDIYRQRLCRRLILKQQQNRTKPRTASINSPSDESERSKQGEQQRMPQTDASCMNLLNQYLQDRAATISDCDETTPLVPSGKRSKNTLGSHLNV